MSKNVVLYDHLNRPIEMKSLETEVASPVSGVRDIWFDSYATNLTPSKLATILAELRDGDVLNFLTIAAEMEEREAHFASVIGTRKNALAGLEPVVEAGGEDAKAGEMADDIRDLIRRPEFIFLVEEQLDALSKGFSVAEIQWNRGSDRWTPGGLKWVDQRWFQFNTESGELRLRDPDVNEGLPLQPFKWIVHYPRLKTGFAVSGGLARIAAVSFMCKNYTLKDWMRFIEIYGMPLRVGRYGPNATLKDKAILKRAVINIGADAAAIIPDSMNIEFNSPGNQNAGMLLYKGTAEWLDKQMSKAVLGQTASTDGTAGSLGNQDGQEDVRRDILRKDGRTLAATLNLMLVKPYIDLNYGPQENYPTLKWDIKDPEDLDTLGTFLGITVPLGLRVKQSEIRDKAGLADPDEDDEILVSPESLDSGEAGAEVAGNSKLETRNSKRRLALNAAGEAGDIVDELEEIALNGWQPTMQPMETALQNLLDECADEEEFKRRLPELAGKVDQSELISSLATATFKARGAGDAEED